MAINLRDLSYFEAAAELQSIGKAAEKLGRTQPAITKAVQRLEEAFDSALFERQGRRVQLTAVGEVLLARARMLRGATDEAYREVEDYARGNAGHVRIGSGPIAADQVLPQLCSLLLREAHQTTVAITVGPTLLLRDRLREGALDLLIGLTPEHSDADVLSQAIVQDVVVVAAASNHPVFDEPELSMQSLLKWSWALPHDSVPSRQWLDQRFDALGLARPHVQISANSIPHLPRLIAKTQLLSFLSRRTLDESRSKALLREVPIEAAQLRRELGVSYRKNGYLSPAAQRLLQLLQSQGRLLFEEEPLAMESHSSSIAQP